MKNVFKYFGVCILALLLTGAVFAAPSAVTVTDNTAELLFDISEPEISLVLFEGNGTEASPYLISSADDFNSYAALVNASGSSYADKYFRLSSNIDFAGAEIIPFGVESTPFKGTLDGNGYALLNVSVPDKKYAGVVGYMTEGTVKNLRVEYKDITGFKTFSYLAEFGGIVGHCEVAKNKNASITGCSTSGNFTLVSIGNYVYFGGIAGKTRAYDGGAVFANCISDMSFDLKSTLSGYVAGCVAYAVSGSAYNCVIKNSVSYGDVSLVTEAGIEAKAGGFTAYVSKDMEGSSGWASETYNFENCAAFGNVYASAKSLAAAGGFVAYDQGDGEFTHNNCYKPEGQSVEAVSKKAVLGPVGTETDKDNISNRMFYEDTLLLDFNNMWYWSNEKPCLRTVAKSFGSATVLEDTEIRLTDNPGIRFRSRIEILKRDYAFEYGIILVDAQTLGDNELTLDFSGKKAVGVAYGEDVDKIFSHDEETLVFSAVIVNMKPEHYAKYVVARPYLKLISEGEEIVVYGNTVKASLSDTAKAIRDSENFEALSDEQQQLLNSMIQE